MDEGQIAEFVKNALAKEDYKQTLAMLYELGLAEKTPEAFKYILEFMLNHDIPWNESYYVFWQLGYVFFVEKKLCSNLNREYMFQIYNKISNQFLSHFSNLMSISNRNSKLVLVMINQFLGEYHAPSKTCLDRAYTLKKYLDKNVILINTAEITGGKPIPLSMGRNANYIDKLSEAEFVPYMDVKFPYMQFSQKGPYLEEAELMVNYVKNIKPEFIVAIGGNSLMVDLCAQMVPVLNVNTVPSDITCTKATFQSVGRNAVLNEQTEKLLNFLGKTNDSVIRGSFTSTIINTEYTKISKTELGITEEAFVIAVVGTRLIQEFSNQFLKMINSILSDQIHLLIIGQMDNYESICAENLNLKNYSTYLGTRTDVLSVLTACDLYVNPPRTGGGMSIIEAFYVGLPGVTLPGGDVEQSAGADFVVKSLDEMAETIKRYSEDREYYHKMAELAKKRAEIMLDTKTAFADILNQFAEKVGMVI